MFASSTLLSVIVLYFFLLPILPNCLCDHSSRIHRKISPFLLAWTETSRLSQLATAHILPPSWFYEYRKVSWVTLCYKAWCTAWCERLLLIFFCQFFQKFGESWICVGIRRVESRQCRCNVSVSFFTTARGKCCWIFRLFSDSWRILTNGNYHGNYHAVIATMEPVRSKC